MILGAKLLIKTIEAIEKGNIKGTPQSELMPADGILKSAPKIFKEDCRINWKEEPAKIINQIRGLSPYPTAYGDLKIDDAAPLSMKIFNAKFEQHEHNQPLGKIETDGKSYFKVCVKGGFITLYEVQLAGKKRMLITDFLRGFRCNYAEFL